MRRIRGRLSFSLLVAGTFLGAAVAAEMPLGGSKLLVQDPTGDPARRKVVVVGAPPAGSTLGLDGDPTIGGATLRIATAGGTPAEQTFDLPALGWQTAPALRFKYTNAADDDAISAAEITTSNGATCNGTYRSTQSHDQDDPHAAAFWWKTRSLRAVSPGLLGALPTG